MGQKRAHPRRCCALHLCAALVRAGCSPPPTERVQGLDVVPLLILAGPQVRVQEPQTESEGAELLFGGHCSDTARCAGVGDGSGEYCGSPKSVGCPEAKGGGGEGPSKTSSKSAARLKLESQAPPRWETQAMTFMTSLLS